MKLNALPSRNSTPARALLSLAAVAVGYQAISCPERGRAGRRGRALGTTTGLTASWDVNGVLLEWDDPDDDTIEVYRVKRRFHREGHASPSRPPVDAELEMHVHHTCDAENRVLRDVARHRRSAIDFTG